MGAMSPTHGGEDPQGRGRCTSWWEQRDPQPKSKNAGYSSQSAQQEREGQAPMMFLLCCLHASMPPGV